MIQFFRDALEHPLLFNALVGGMLASLACGLVGSYVVVRRITYVAGGIAHSVLGGVGLAVYLNALGWSAVLPIHGALAVGLAAAALIGWVSLRGGQREDTLIGAVWSIGMAAGVIFLHLTPGYAQDPMAYLFGNILMVGTADLWLIAGLVAVILGIVWACYNPLLAVCFDEEFARVRGVPVERYYMLLLCLTALTIVTLMKVVGLVLVIALLTLPVAVASRFANTLSRLLVLSTAFSLAFTVFGLALSYSLEWPTGATIILVAGAAYGLTALPGTRRLA